MFELIFFIFIGFLLFFLFWHSYATRNSPYISIPNEVLPETIKTLHVKKGDIVYDLGSGDGKVLFALYEKEPNAKYIGIDISYWPYFVSKRKKEQNHDKADLTFYRQDVFDTELSAATHIFIYSSAQFMDDILPKLKKELVKGTRLVSCDFKFSDKKEIQVIDLGRQGEKFGKNLYVYEF
ncbi:MAG: methyltransferase domain-containing protein [bacterium]